jgi:hypothetical protein
MKKRNIIIITFMTLLLHGCFIKSIHPFYQEKDVIFKSQLLGRWMDQDSSVWQITQMTRSLGFMLGDTVDNSYEMLCEDVDGNKTYYDTHLFKIGNDWYLDFFPMLGEILEDNLVMNSIIPSHSLAKFHIRDNNRIVVNFFDEDWLDDLMEKNRVKISHEKTTIGGDIDAYVLTASSDELQKFIAKYGNDPNLFKVNWETLEKGQERDDFCFYLDRLNE